MLLYLYCIIRLGKYLDSRNIYIYLYIILYITIYIYIYSENSGHCTDYGIALLTIMCIIIMCIKLNMYIQCHVCNDNHCIIIRMFYIHMYNNNIYLCSKVHNFAAVEGFPTKKDQRKR